MISLRRWPKVEDLRAKLNGKAKAQSEYQFYTLYDKVYRMDFLEAAYAQVRRNAGAPGVDRQDFADIEAYGVPRYLSELAEELKELRYASQPVRRVLIPKENQPGKYRPLGIPTIRDRIVQQAVKLLLEPIFEADLTDDAYGYRAGRSANDAVRAVNKEVFKRPDVVDADLSKYFDTIPHEALLTSVQRRIGDRRILWLIRHWLKVPVHETNAKGQVVVTGGRNTKCGTPQGGVISPLLANIYFRRFLVAWTKFGCDQKYDARIVNYADDFVILTRRHAPAALHTANQIMKVIGLTLNETKTRIVNAWEGSFTFLGYTFGKLYGRKGKPYLGEVPADKNLRQYRQKVHALTASDQCHRKVEEVAQDLNVLTRGFWNYYTQGTLSQVCRDLDNYVWSRMRKWVLRKHSRSRSRTLTTGRRMRRRKAVLGAVQLLTRGQDLLRARNGGPLFAAGQSYAAVRS